MVSVLFYVSGKNFDSTDVRVRIALKAFKYGVGRFYAEYVQRRKVMVVVDAPRNRIDTFYNALKNERLDHELDLPVIEITKPEPHRSSSQLRGK